MSISAAATEKRLQSIGSGKREEFEKLKLKNDFDEIYFHAK